MDHTFNTHRNHPLIQREQTYVLEKKLLAVHSEDRDFTQFPNSNHFSLDIGEAMNNPFVSERNGIHEFPNPANPSTNFKMVAHPIKSSGDTPLRNPAPKLGQNTDAVLRETGYTPDQIKKLRDKGIL